MHEEHYGNESRYEEGQDHEFDGYDQAEMFHQQQD